MKHINDTLRALLMTHGLSGEICTDCGNIIEACLCYIKKVKKG